MAPDTLSGVATSSDNRTVSHPASLSLSGRNSETPSAAALPQPAPASASASSSDPVAVSVSVLESNPGPGSVSPPSSNPAAGSLPASATAMSKSTTETALKPPSPSPSSTTSTIIRPDTASLGTAQDRNDLLHHQQTNPPLQYIPSSQQSQPQSFPRSETNSQESTMTSSSEHALTPTTSDASNGAGPVNGFDHHDSDQSNSTSQLHQLSALAAAQDRISTNDVLPGSRKRMADGEVKPGRGSTSPVKGHKRATSAISMASTGSHIEELSAGLRMRLSYAMLKVNNGWQSHSIEEVEGLASRVASPTSSPSTVHRRHGSSTSPRVTMHPQVHFATDALIAQGTGSSSGSPPKQPSHGANGPTLAPPAPIQPSTSATSHMNPRRNSNPRYTPTLLSTHSHGSSTSPRTPGQPPRLTISHSRDHGTDPVLYSPHKNVREQDAIESLLFMSSPGNSANLKHAFSPAGSPGPGSGPRGAGRHALPSGPRKTLPNQRPQQPQKKNGLDRSPGMPPPGSPMDLDSPQQYATPNRGTPRRRTIGSTSNLRGSLSLPSGLGVGNEMQRRTLKDEDIERMLDRATAETADSSDDEEIQIPQGRGNVPSAMEV